MAHLLLSSASTPLGSEYNLLESSSKSLSQCHFSVEYSLQVCHRYVDNRCYHKNNKVQRYIYITNFFCRKLSQLNEIFKMFWWCSPPACEIKRTQWIHSCLKGSQTFLNSAPLHFSYCELLEWLFSVRSYSHIQLILCVEILFVVKAVHIRPVESNSVHFFFKSVEIYLFSANKKQQPSQGILYFKAKTLQ